MQNRILLGPVTGALDDKSAKIWLYGRIPVENEVLICELFYRDNDQPVPGGPAKFNALGSLPYIRKGVSYLPYLTRVEFPDPKRKYYFKIKYLSRGRDWAEPGNHILDPFPQKGKERFSFGLISCHRAFSSRRSHHKRDRMWKQLKLAMDSHQAKFLLQVGDQVYCDTREHNAWKACHQLSDPAERLRLYREVYLDSWNFAGLKTVLTGFPQYMIWDDHEITDGWGSMAEHQEPENIAVYDTAARAYGEFQHAHNPDPLRLNEYFYEFCFGEAVFFVLDLRGHRNRVKKQLLGDQQWQVFSQWIRTGRIKQKKVLFLVSSVPVFHLSRAFGSLGRFNKDLADQWSYAENKRERAGLLKHLYQWLSDDPDKLVYILSGDVHVGTEVCMVHRKEKKLIQQISSSPITNRVSGFLDFIFAVFSKKISPIRDWEGEDHIRVRIIKRHRKKNFAMVTVEYDEKGKPQVRLNMYRKKEKKPQKPNKDLHAIGRKLFKKWLGQY